MANPIIGKHIHSTMATLLKLRLGVADDRSAVQPALSNCIEAVLQQSDLLVTDVVNGLALALAPASPRRIPAFQHPAIRSAIENLGVHTRVVCATFRQELSRVVYEGGGNEQAHTALLRFEDLQLFDNAELDQSIEVARAQQEVALAVDDVLAPLDALVSTLLGWRTIQPGLNPLRPDAFVRALQSTLALHVPEARSREILMTPAAGLLGANLRRLYRELSDWLGSCGIEPAVPIGGKIQKGKGAAGASVTDSVAKTMLTLDKLRKLLAGDFDHGAAKVDFLHTMPASMAMLQDMKQVDTLVRRLEERPRPAHPAASAPQPAASHETPPPRLGHQLGEEVVRLMFDTLDQDPRLLREYKRQLREIEPAILKLAQSDSRFFSDRNHTARQFLDRLTQRSLAFSAETDDGWPRFLITVEAAVRWLDSKIIDADTFGELVDHLQAQWARHDTVMNQRRDEAARALVHAEQRNLLAQKVSSEFAAALEGLQVAQFVADFLKGSWAQVVAEVRLAGPDSELDLHGYRALADDLIWSVQKSTAQRGRNRRLAEMIPVLLTRLREGLARIDYPPELTARFFDNLVTIHLSALQEGRDAAAKAAADMAEAEPSGFSDSLVDATVVWLAGQEASESGYLDAQDMEAEEQARPEAPATRDPRDPRETAEPAPVASGELRPGTWVELMVEGRWLRVQLTWASPHATLFMFTSLAGTAHSMSRRTMERLRGQGLIKVIAERNVVDDALDQVAKAALDNTVAGKT